MVLAEVVFRQTRAPGDDKTLTNARGIIAHFTRGTIQTSKINLSKNNLSKIMIYHRVLFVLKGIHIKTKLL